MKSNWNKFYSWSRKVILNINDYEHLCFLNYSGIWCWYLWYKRKKVHNFFFAPLLYPNVIEDTLVISKNVILNTIMFHHRGKMELQYKILTFEIFYTPPTQQSLTVFTGFLWLYRLPSLFVEIWAQCLRMDLNKVSRPKQIIFWPSLKNCLCAKMPKMDQKFYFLWKWQICT